MGLGSAFEKISGAAATLPNAAGFDKDGNLYVADTVSEAPRSRRPSRWRAGYG
jgi:hypothetical protein